MSQRDNTRNRFNFKFGLAFRELGAMAVLIAGILCFHYSGLSLCYPYEWLANIGIGITIIALIYLFGCYGNPFCFKKWYNEENLVIEYDPIKMCEEGEIEYPQRDAFWEYLSILGIIVVPSSFLISFFITEYGVDITTVPWYYWIACAIYCGLVIFPILGNLKHKTYRQQPEIRTDYKETKRVRRLQKALIEVSPLEAFNVSVIHRAIVIMISDYIWDCAEQYSPKSSKYDRVKYEALIDLRATRMEILTDPLLAAFRMLSGLEGMLDREIEEPEYLKLDYICDTLYDSILNYALSLQPLHLV